MKTISGNLLSQTTGVLVHGCNCQGKMGSGIAGPMRKLYPGVYSSYMHGQRSQGLKLGDAQFVSRPGPRPRQIARHLTPAMTCSQLPSELVVVNALTQEFYGKDPSVVYVDYDAVFAAFAKIRLLARDMDAPVRFPKIGAGLANGDWNTVVEAIACGLRDQFDRAELWLLPAGADEQPASSQTTLEGI